MTRSWTRRRRASLRDSAVRYTPELRSAYVERLASGPAMSTYYGTTHYFDSATLPEEHAFVRASSVGFLWVLLRDSPSYVEIPEPLWTKRMISTMAMLLVAKVSSLMRGRRVRVATYCIENELSERIARLPHWFPAEMRTAALRPLLLPFVILLDAWAFGTRDSARTYRGVAGNRLWRRVSGRARVIWPLPSECQCPDVPPSTSHDVLFVGELSSRKGVDALVAAWPLIASEVAGARLTIAGRGPLEGLVGELAGRRDVVWAPSARRTEIHECFRRAQVLVLLSKPERYWREQFGLPVAEGLAHNCDVVVTASNGLSDWLESNGQSVLPQDSSVAQIAETIVRLLHGYSKSTVVERLPMVNGRAAASWWLLGGTFGHQADESSRNALDGGSVA